MFSRERLSENVESEKENAKAKRDAQKRRRLKKKNAKAMDSHLSELKKRPSLIFRLLNRTVKDQKWNLYDGYEPVPGGNGVSLWPGGILRRISLFGPSRRLSCDSELYHPEMMEELLRYFGSDSVKQQLLLQTTRGTFEKPVFVHHPINPHILEARSKKQDRESACQGRLPPQSRRSFLLFRNSRLDCESDIRIMNRNGESWKLLSYSKAANPPMGLGELSLGGEGPPSIYILTWLID